MEELGEEDFEQLLFILVKIYTLADKLGDCASENLVADFLIDAMLHTSNIPSGECVLYL